MATIASRADEAASAHTEQARLQTLASDPSPQVRRRVAANRNTAREIVARLAGDRDWRTRGIVATRVDLPAEVLIPLVTDRAWQVRCALTETRHADPKVLEALVRAPNTDTRMMLANQSWLPLDIAMLLAQDDAKNVRQALAASTEHPQVHSALTEDAHHDVRAATLANAALVTAHVLAAASRDSSAGVRASAAEDGRLPAEDRQRLMTDRSRHVRQTAREALAAPDHSEVLDTETLDPGVSELDLSDPQTLVNWPTPPRKPSTKWFRLFSFFRPSSDDVPKEVVQYWRIAAAIDADPEWITWWKHATPARLEITTEGRFPSPIELQQRGDTLYALIDDRLIDLAPEQNADRLRHVLARIAENLHLPPPPPLPKRSQPHSSVSKPETGTARGPN